jgi:hypothetical protein
MTLPPDKNNPVGQMPEILKKARSKEKICGA